MERFLRHSVDSRISYEKKFCLRCSRSQVLADPGPAVVHATPVCKLHRCGVLALPLSENWPAARLHRRGRRAKCMYKKIYITREFLQPKQSRVRDRRPY